MLALRLSCWHRDVPFQDGHHHVGAGSCLHCWTCTFLPLVPNQPTLLAPFAHTEAEGGMLSTWCKTWMGKTKKNTFAVKWASPVWRRLMLMHSCVCFSNKWQRPDYKVGNKPAAGYVGTVLFLPRVKIKQLKATRENEPKHNRCLSRSIHLIVGWGGKNPGFNGIQKLRLTVTFSPSPVKMRLPTSFVTFSSDLHVSLSLLPKLPNSAAFDPV